MNNFATDIAEDYGNSIANALELPQSCTKPSVLPKQGWFYAYAQPMRDVVTK